MDIPGVPSPWLTTNPSIESASFRALVGARKNWYLRFTDSLGIDSLQSHIATHVEVYTLRSPLGLSTAQLEADGWSALDFYLLPTRPAIGANSEKGKLVNLMVQSSPGFWLLYSERWGKFPSTESAQLWAENNPRWWVYPWEYAFARITGRVGFWPPTTAVRTKEDANDIAGLFGVSSWQAAAAGHSGWADHGPRFTSEVLLPEWKDSFGAGWVDGQLIWDLEETIGFGGDLQAVFAARPGLGSFDGIFPVRATRSTAATSADLESIGRSWGRWLQGLRR